MTFRTLNGKSYKVYQAKPKPKARKKNFFNPNFYESLAFLFLFFGAIFTFCIVMQKKEAESYQRGYKTALDSIQQINKPLNTFKNENF